MEMQICMSHPSHTSNKILLILFGIKHPWFYIPACNYEWKGVSSANIEISVHNTQVIFIWFRVNQFILAQEYFALFYISNVWQPSCVMQFFAYWHYMCSASYLEYWKKYISINLNPESQFRKEVNIIFQIMTWLLTCIKPLHELLLTNMSDVT